jgi:RNA polymerase sigma-70 factor (ECF subfamily)
VNASVSIASDPSAVRTSIAAGVGARVQGGVMAAAERIESDAELLGLLAAQPVVALARIYDRHASLVYGLAYAILGNKQEAEDLTQEIFVNLLNKCAYDPARGSFAGFLTTMTRSRAIDQIRSRQRSARLLGAWSEEPERVTATALDEAADGECARSVQSALAALPATQRRVLELAYFKGLTHMEIADVLQTPLGTVKTWARNGLYSLRDALKEYVE